MRILFPLLAIALTGCAASATPQANPGDDKDLAKALAGRTAGKPVDCIDRSFAGGPEIIDNKTLLDRSGRHIYRNDLEASCPSLRETSILVIEAHGSQMCRNDLFRPTEPGGVVPGPICRLGKFTPYDKPKP